MSQFFDRGFNLVFGGGGDTESNESTSVSLPPPRPAGTEYVSKQDRREAASTAASNTGGKPEPAPGESGSKNVNVKDLDRDQLIHLSQKLNKRLHSTSNKVKTALQQVTDKDNDLQSVNSVLTDTLNVRIPYTQPQQNSGSTKHVDVAKFRRNLKAALREREAEEQSMRTSLQAQLDQVSHDHDVRRKALEREIEELQQEQSNKDSEIENLLQQLHSLKNQNSRAQKNEKRDKTTSKSIQTEVSAESIAQQGEIERLTQELEKKDSELHSLRSYYDEELRKAKGNDKSAGEARDEVKEMQEKVESLSKELKDINEDRKSLEASLREAQSKSKNARNMVARKDAEIDSLKKQVSELRVQAEYGSPAEQHFVRLAEEQANRDYKLNSLQRELDRSRTKIEELRSQLSAANTAKERLEGQLSSLQNPKNVEKVNMVYLKNIVVKYMAYADDAPEKQFMRRVIATLLQFNSEDEDFLQHAPIPGGVVKQALEPQESG
eukprot:gb/GECG01002562.1/.p1 GENE.gb/GECG01002562.1/~~gb/GECG01002562.1/.p1  ORF type:complete len:493 (+),score=100.55 gb/GECG01002562.1/:1-1479(+)